MWAGDDLQSEIHQGRKKDADYMARAKVLSTQRSRVRFASTPHGMGKRPEDSLVQRIFANPMSGAYHNYSARQDQNGAPWGIYERGMERVQGEYSGGVMRTPRGRDYVAKRLTGRISELDVIQQEAQMMVPGAMAQSPFAPSMGRTSDAQTMAINTQVNESTAIELNLLLESIMNACQGGDAGGEALTRFTVSDATRALLIIFRVIPTAHPDFAEDLMGKVNTIISLLDDILDPDMDSAGERVEARENALSLQILFTKLREYLTRMMGGKTVTRYEERFNPTTGKSERIPITSTEQGQNLSPAERLSLSKALVTDLGFSKNLKSSSVRAGLESQYRQRGDAGMNAQERQRFREGDMDADEGDGDDDFDENGEPREDLAHDRETGVERGDRDFDEDGRDAFGEQRGPAGTLGIFPAYYNEPPLATQAPRNPPRPRGVIANLRLAEDAPEEERVVGRFDETTGNYNVDRAGPRPATPRSAARAAPPADGSISTRVASSASSVSTTPSAVRRLRVQDRFGNPDTASRPVMAALGLRNNSTALPRASAARAGEIEAVISRLESAGLVTIRANGIKNRKAALIRQMKGKNLWSF